MPGIVLSAQCGKLVNKGGGFPTKTVREVVKGAFGSKHSIHHHYQSLKRIKGTDYVIFNCPGCGKRNKRSAYDVKGSVGQAISFKCNGCLREIEVARPTPPIQNVIVSPQVPQIPSGLVNAAGRPIVRS